MRERSMVPASIIRCLEDKYGMFMKRGYLTRKLRYDMDNNYPKSKSCSNLIHTLVNMQSDDPHMYLKVETEGDNKRKGERSMRAVCWEERTWLEDYHQFGVLPGVSIDAKAVATDFGTPFVSIRGRDIGGNLRVFFMGFFSNERQDSIQCFLQCFKQFIVIPPKLVACDQDMDIMNAIREVFPTSFIALDNWYLSKNQIKNCIKAGKSGGFNAAELNSELHALRKSESAEEFYQKRNEIEEKYFSSIENLPQWYEKLYYTDRYLCIRCFNRCTSPSFRFQGSVYAESVNAMYKRITLDARLPLSSIPLEVQRYLRKKRLEDEAEYQKVKYNRYSHRVLCESLGLRFETWNAIAQKYTNNALEYVIGKSVSLSSRYNVRLLTEAGNEFPSLPQKVELKCFLCYLKSVFR